MWPVVKESCNNACWLVVLVRCRARGCIIAYCRDCGAGWLSPADLEENYFGIGSRCVPKASKSRRERRSLGKLGRYSEGVCLGGGVFATSEINESLTRERAEWASKPPWRERRRQAREQPNRDA